MLLYLLTKPIQLEFDQYLGTYISTLGSGTSTSAIRNEPQGSTKCEEFLN